MASVPIRWPPSRAAALATFLGSQLGVREFYRGRQTGNNPNLRKKPTSNGGVCCKQQRGWRKVPSSACISLPGPSLSALGRWSLFGFTK